MSRQTQHSTGFRRPASSSVLAVILAAGAGSRFQGENHKLLASFRGHTVIGEAVANALAAGFAEVVVVTGAVELGKVLPPAVTLVHNPAWQQGQATSLQTAIAYAESKGYEAVVVGLGDQPFIQPETWKDLASALGPIAVATYDGLRRNPVKLHREVWGLLPREGDAGARVLIKARPDLVVEVPAFGAPVDIDTVEDLAEWI